VREDEFLVKPVLSEQHDSAASVTSVVLFQDCPRRYYIARYLGWDDRARPRPAELGEGPGESALAGSPGAAEFGRQVHALLAGEPAPEACSEARDLAARFHASELGARAARAGRIEREAGFIMDLDGLILNGQIDVWFEEGGELVLADYKTDDVPAAAAPLRAESYALQLRLYALAIERLAGRLPDSARLCFLRPNVAVRVDLGAPQLESARETVHAFQRAQDEMRFPLNVGEHCSRCPFYAGLCPAGSDVTGRRQS
jgi:hypothetical protein